MFWGFESEAKSGGFMNLKESFVPQPGKTTGLAVEEKIGVRLFVWIGAIALAWAGILLVKYSLDQGWISPVLRITLGILLGITFLTTGEWIRSRAIRVSQAFSAAGIVDLYASFLAAHHLYHLTNVPTTFLFLTLTTAVAVLISLHQGSMAAILGLLGGFLTPIWISSTQPDAAVLFSYLLVLQIGLLVVARRRQWRALALLTFLGSNVWAFAWLLFHFRTGEAVYAGAFLTLAPASFLFLTHSGSQTWRDDRIVRAFHRYTAPVSLILLAILTIQDRYAPFEWSLLGTIGALFLIAGRKNDSYLRMSYLTAAMSAFLLLSWSGKMNPAFLQTTFLLGLLFAAGSYFAMWNSERPSRYAAVSVCSSICYFLIAYWGDSLGRQTLPWSTVSMLCAAAFVAAGFPVVKRGDLLKEGNRILAMIAVGATAFVTFSIAIQLEKEWLVIALSMEAVVLLWIASRLRVAELRTVSLALAILVMLRLLTPAGFTQRWYWLLYGYGIPLLSFWWAAAIHEQEQRKNLSAIFRLFIVLLAFLLCTFEVRLFFHRGEAWSFGAVAPYESCGYSLAWLFLGAVLLRVSQQWNHRMFVWIGKLILLLGLFQLLPGQLFGQNPLWTHHPVGKIPVLNLLIPLYGLPALLLLFSSSQRVWEGERHLTILMELIALFLAFVFMNLEIRQLFHGTYLDTGTTTALEKYAYSVAWMLFALLLIVVGMWKQGLLIRYCSLGFMLAAIGKVFLYDTKQLSDLYRFFSFFGLGLSLLFVAYLYQKFLFRRELRYE